MFKNPDYDVLVDLRVDLNFPIIVKIQKILSVLLNLVAGGRAWSMWIEPLLPRLNWLKSFRVWVTFATNPRLRLRPNVILNIYILVNTRSKAKFLLIDSICFSCTLLIPIFVKFDPFLLDYHVFFLLQLQYNLITGLNRTAPKITAW
jgi:hypothetical protein